MGVLDPVPAAAERWMTFSYGSWAGSSLMCHPDPGAKETPAVA
ncbi:MAG: hypothetical protein JWM62_1152 [Frankiales bacterium]|nr:hypothetical protein [Frankiales bacterium]